MKQYWVKETKTYERFDDGSERVLTEWWRNYEQYPNLQRAIRDWIINDLNLDLYENKWTLETYKNDEGEIVIKNEQRKNILNVESTVVHEVKFYLIEEDTMRDNDLEQVSKKFSWLGGL